MVWPRLNVETASSIAFKAIRLTLAGLVGESVEAFDALEDLQCPQTIVPLSFSHGIFRSAFGTGWILQ
jgi:hypothetical protein